MSTCVGYQLNAIAGAVAFRESCTASSNPPPARAQSRHGQKRRRIPLPGKAAAPSGSLNIRMLDAGIRAPIVDGEKRLRAHYFPATFSSRRMGFRILILFVSTMQPFVTISSVGEKRDSDARTGPGSCPRVRHTLTENIVCLLDVEHDVELADVFEVLVKSLDKRVNELEHAQFVLREARSPRECAGFARESEGPRATTQLLPTSSSCSTPTIKKRDAYLL